MKQILKKALLFACGSAAIVLSARADTINISTGVDSSGNLLASGALQTLYTVSGAANQAVVEPYSQKPGSWVSNQPDAQWITGSSNLSPLSSTGIFSYSLNVFANDPNGVDITGRFTSDNPGQLVVNGTVLYDSPGWPSHDDGTYSSWYNFGTIHLNYGENNITWNVSNLGGPQGLIVEASATGNDFSVGVPDGGATAALLGSALVGFALLRRRMVARL
jgi:hypothetical protein